MFSWLNSPQLPETIETQAFRSISGGPILRINAINDRTHKMKLIPWEDILEVFPNAIYLRDANGIVMPARDLSLKRITPRSIKLQADVVLEVVSTQDPPPTSSRPQNITKTTDIIDSQSAGKDVATSLSSQVNDHATESQYAQTRTSTSSTVASDRRSSDKIQQQQKDEDQLDWTPFQANTLPFQKNTSTLLSEQSQLIRQEVIHWMQLLSAEQEERLEVMLKALRRPAR